MFLGRLKSFFLDITEVVVFAIAIFLFLYLLVLQPHKIKGASMEPNFHNGEYLLTDKVTYRFGEPERGDVIVFAAPPDETEDFIKRIIALPGEKMSVHEGFVFINGQRLNEIYLPNGLITESGDFFKDGRPKRIIMIVYAPFKNGKEVYSYPDPDNLTKRLKIQSVKYDIITESVI